MTPETLTDPFASKRRLMVRDQIVARGIGDPRVLSTMRVLPRHLFVPLEEREHAHEDRPLPIGDGATISQPLIAATMTEALRLDGVERVLEVGTGSGYQTALLCELAGEVWSIEIDLDIAARAQRLLRQLQYGERLHLRSGNGDEGWPEAAPFDRILVGAAPERVPKKLIAQLAEGGRLVAPVGPPSNQRLLAIDRVGKKTETTDLGGVRFVPLRREPV